MENFEISSKITLDAPPVRNLEDYPNIEYHIKGKDNKQYNIKIYQSEKSVIFLTNEINDILNIKYKIELNLEEFYNLNRIFRQYISVEELFTLYFKSLKEHEIIISKQDKNIKLSLLIEFGGQKEEISLTLKPENIQYEEVIIKLYEKIKELELSFDKEKNDYNTKIKDLEEKLDKKNNIINNLIERINNLENNYNKSKENNTKIDSMIIKDNELNLIESGIRHNFNKGIKNYELLIRGSRDGFDANDFHNKCDNKNFTVAFIETSDGKRFGGFTEETWDQSSHWKYGPKSFIFSFDNKEIYYVKKGYNSIYCYESGNPNILGFGGGHDFKLWDKCNTNCYSYDNSGNSYETNGKEFALAGKEYFCVKDYEVFKINLI